jgi:hypothetical protein
VVECHFPPPHICKSRHSRYLYYLHEIIHAITIAHVPGISFEAFQQKMTANELETSLATEILVYFEIAGLRDKAFGHDIYADRFLGDRSFRLSA